MPFWAVLFFTSTNDDLTPSRFKQIFVFDAGQVVEKGPPEELLIKVRGGWVKIVDFLVGKPFQYHPWDWYSIFTYIYIHLPKNQPTVGNHYYHLVLIRRE